jgi:hypothetical protein
MQHSKSCKRESGSGQKLIKLEIVFYASAFGGRVARWHIFVPKMAFWYILGGLASFGAFHNLLACYRHYMVFLWPFDIFFPFWIVVPRNFWQP